MMAGPSQQATLLIVGLSVQTSHGVRATANLRMADIFHRQGLLPLNAGKGPPS